MTTALRLLPELEQSLVQLPGVRAASVVTAADGSPTEIHVLATGDKPAKQVVRDVQSLAMARHDLDIDHRIVSVVQLEPEDLSSVRIGAAGDPQRPVLTSLVLRTTQGVLEAGVTLALGDALFEGSASGPGTPAARPRLLARAALNAVHDLLGVPAEVDQAEVVGVGGHRVAVCVVAIEAPRAGSQLLTGSALVRGDEADAVARALLDAVNRRLSG